MAEQGGAEPRSDGLESPRSVMLPRRSVGASGDPWQWTPVKLGLEEAADQSRSLGADGRCAGARPRARHARAARKHRTWRERRKRREQRRHAGAWHARAARAHARNAAVCVSVRVYRARAGSFHSRPQRSAQARVMLMGRTRTARLSRGRARGERSRAHPGGFRSARAARWRV